jgi:hypothetical protein
MIAAIVVLLAVVAGALSAWFSSSCRVWGVFELFDAHGERDEDDEKGSMPYWRLVQRRLTLLEACRYVQSVSWRPGLLTVSDTSRGRGRKLRAMFRIRPCLIGDPPENGMYRIPPGHHRTTRRFLKRPGEDE